MKKKFILITIAFISSVGFSQTFEVYSPNGKTKLSISADKNIKWQVSRDNEQIIDSCLISLDLGDRILGADSYIQSNKINQIDEQIIPIVAQKNQTILNKCNELLLYFKQDFALHFRVYNEGISYRFETFFNHNIKVFNEQMDVYFPSGTTSYFPLEESLYSHYERSYVNTNLDTLTSKHFASLPLLFDKGNNVKIIFSEADLFDYPNMFIKGTYSDQISALFPKVVLETEQWIERPDRMEVITKEANFIAQTNGNRTFPWRVFGIVEQDIDLLSNDMIYSLSRPLEIADVSWIKPGKVAWDWYNKNNLYGIDFKAGINTESYKYYIDFAAKYGLEYVILDEGWSKSVLDIESFNPNMDVKEIINYGKSKGVGVILWCLWKPLYEKLEAVLEQYESWGAAGIKVDFMQRADQNMVNIYTAIAKEAAKHKLLVDFHGAYKPSGLRRAYPNVLTYEGVRGSENNKWSNQITPTHNVTLPYIRSVVGPMDYTPGAMRNAHLKDHHISFDKPASLGTRAHQVAMYVVFESPLQMLCDSPSDYLKDEHTVNFISKIPTVWDKTIPLEGKIGEYVVVARAYESKWYIGAMNNENDRTVNVDLSMLPPGNYEATIFEDGMNSDVFAEDYNVKSIEVNNRSVVPVHLANGGGWSAIITPLKH